MRLDYSHSLLCEFELFWLMWTLIFNLTEYNLPVFGKIKKIKKNEIKKNTFPYWSHENTLTSNKSRKSYLFNFFNRFTCLKLLRWRRGVAVITAGYLHSTKPKLRFCAGSNPACGLSKIRDGEDLWQRSRLKIRLNAFRWSTIPQKNNSSLEKCFFNVRQLIWFDKNCI